MFMKWNTKNFHKEAILPDRRFKYVPFHTLSERDQNRAIGMFLENRHVFYYDDSKLELMSTVNAAIMKLYGSMKFIEANNIDNQINND